MFDPKQMQQAAKYVVHMNCPMEYLQEDATSAAILKMIERASEYDAERSSIKTFLIQQATYGVRNFLRNEFGRGCRERNTFPIEENVVRYHDYTGHKHTPHTQGDQVDAFVDAETLLDMDRRLKVIDEGTPNPTVAQWRGNLPEVSTARMRA